MKKKASKLTAEELLAVLDETPKDISMKTDVYQYILDSEFKESTKLLPNALIYYFYITNPKYKQKYTRRAFFRHFSQFFKGYKQTLIRGYKVTPNWTATEEDILKARIVTRHELYEKVQQKRGRKSKKKGQQEEDKETSK